MNFKEIKPRDLDENIFTITGKDWFLITAGTIDNFNTMTAGWGGMGVLWNKNVCFVYIRPSRYTYKFMEKSETFTLNFFDEKHKKTLSYCGSHSGREVDKVKETGIIPEVTSSGSVFFQEARLIIECRKIYYQDIDPDAFLDASIEKNYTGKDYHRLYVGEVIQCMTSS